MTETITFTTLDNRTYTAKKTFLEKCPEPSKFKGFDLAKDFHLSTFLHNENGPAVIVPRRNSNSVVEYWLDGLCITALDKAAADRIAAKVNFNQEFNDFINSPTEGSNG